MRSRAVRLFSIVAACVCLNGAVTADSIPVQILDPNLEVSTVLTGVIQPIGIVFLAGNDFLVLEKASGQVKRVINGLVQATPDQTSYVRLPH